MSKKQEEQEMTAVQEMADHLTYAVAIADQQPTGQQYDSLRQEVCRLIQMTHEPQRIDQGVNQ